MRDWREGRGGEVGFGKVVWGEGGYRVEGEGRGGEGHRIG